MDHFSYCIYIATTPEKLWHALIQGTLTKKYFFGNTIESDWHLGSRVVFRTIDGASDVHGIVLTYEPHKLLSYTWEVEGDTTIRKHPTRVTYKIEPIDHAVKLTVIHDSLMPSDISHDDDELNNLKNAWPAILSNLKSLLETQHTLKFYEEAKKPRLHSKSKVGLLMAGTLTVGLLFAIFISASYRENPMVAGATTQKKISKPTATPNPTKTPTPTTKLAPITKQTITPTPISQTVIASPLNLTNWKLTLPTGNQNSPREITQPELNNFNLDPWFVVQSDKIRFRAAVNGVTTSGSRYPRSELREMTNNGLEQAAWSSNSGRHTMYIDEAITAVPQVKQQVVAGQIHDSNDDIIVIRLDYPVLYINVGGSNKYALDTNYELGRRFNVKFYVHDGKTEVYYNNSSSPVFTLSKSYSSSYFKAGDYTQSNCSKEKSSSLCNDNNYGEVIIYNLSVNHE